MIDALTRTLIVEGYKQGKTTKELAEDYKVTIATVINILSRAGLEIRRPGVHKGEHIKQIDIEELRAMREFGMSVAEIAFHYGVSRPTVYSRLKEL